MKNGRKERRKKKIERKEVNFPYLNVEGKLKEKNK